MPDRISFTRPAVERIANVVRAVENARPAGAGLRSRAVVPQSSKPFKVCTFTGAWAIDTAKVVTFRGVTTTVSVTNLIYDLPSQGTLPCNIAKDGTAWYLATVDPPSVERGTFTAPWPKGTTKTITDANTAGKTYTGVANYFADITGTGTKACAIAYVGTEWILIAAEC
jgi:hypothetical protein